MVLRDILLPPDDDIEQPSENLQFDLTVLEAIWATIYLRGWPEVAKCGNLHLAWEYAQDPHDHKRFINMLRVSPHVFDFILTLIKDHPVFFNNSHVPQTPVDVQLAVTLYCMGHFGNGASLEDIAQTGFNGGIHRLLFWGNGITGFGALAALPLAPWAIA